MLHTDPGFRPEHVLTASLSLPRQQYKKDVDIAGFYDRLTKNLAALPGVRYAGVRSRQQGQEVDSLGGDAAPRNLVIVELSAIGWVKNRLWVLAQITKRSRGIKTVIAVHPVIIGSISPAILAEDGDACRRPRPSGRLIQPISLCFSSRSPPPRFRSPRWMSMPKL